MRISPTQPGNLRERRTRPELQRRPRKLRKRSRPKLKMEVMTRT
jgi:hypothetical protein